ncbi:MAG: hypothetical protein ACLSV0_03960, partial [Lachnospira eligens]
YKESKIMRDKYNVRKIADSYKFDESYEINIYNYLCFKKMNKKIKEKMNNDVKFITYHQWENYIQNKYKDLNKFELMEFSRFLNLKSRNLKPEHEYWNIVTTILLTILTEKAYNEIINMGIDESDTLAKIVGQFIGQFLIFIGIGIGLVFLIVKITKFIWDVSDKSNFYYDYKKIIDNMIEALDEENYHKKG